LINDLEKAGWVLDHFTGSNRVFRHPGVYHSIALNDHG